MTRARQPNKSAPGKGGIIFLFHAGRGLALPELLRWAEEPPCV
jgi:hypothetical protein